MKILCVDGGGILGALPSFLLARTRSELPEFDAYGGTSIGSIICASYAIGKSYYNTHEFFVGSADDIFHSPFWSRFNPLRKSKYSDKGIELALSNWFGNRVLRNVKPYLIIPTYDYTNGKPKVFDNISTRDDMDMKIWEMCRASSAAPTYFPPYKGMIDGGIIANNPVMVTAWALKHKLGIEYEDMEILSIGTGIPFDHRKGNRKLKIYTKAGWLDPMLDMLTTGNEQVFHFGAQQVGFKKYVRFNPFPLEDGWEMDNADIITDLEVLCSKYMKNFIREVREFNDDSSTNN